MNHEQQLMAALDRYDARRMLNHDTEHDGRGWLCSCGWRPASSSRQAASLHRHQRAEQLKAQGKK